VTNYLTVIRVEFCLWLTCQC